MSKFLEIALLVDDTIADVLAFKPIAQVIDSYKSPPYRTKARSYKPGTFERIMKRTLIRCSGCNGLSLGEPIEKWYTPYHNHLRCPSCKRPPSFFTVSKCRRIIVAHYT